MKTQFNAKTDQIENLKPLAFAKKAQVGIALIFFSISTGYAETNQMPVAGQTTIGVNIEELSRVATGWSAKKSILGKAVYNEKGEKVGKALDLIIAPDKNVSYLIIGTGGFIGIDRHDVAIPIKQVHEKAGKLTLAGATQAAIKAMPEFQYAPNPRDRS